MTLELEGLKKVREVLEKNKITPLGIADTFALGYNKGIDFALHVFSESSKSDLRAIEAEVTTTRDTLRESMRTKWGIVVPNDTFGNSLFGVIKKLDALITAIRSAIGD